jgi:hypothetical protein
VVGGAGSSGMGQKSVLSSVVVVASKGDSWFSWWWGASRGGGRGNEIGCSCICGFMDLYVLLRVFGIFIY